MSYLNLIFVILGYLLGSFPSAYIIGKKCRKGDIRTQGSGNVGATNVLRVVGILPGLITLLLDMGKGFLAVWTVVYLTDLCHLEVIEILPIIVGLAAVLGHNWPVFLKFKGGKGVATTLGVCLALYPAVALMVISVWFLTLFLVRYVSLASIISALSLPFFVWIYFLKSHLFLSNFIFGVILAFLMIWRHQANIKRLFDGQEKKINFFKSG